LLLQKQNPSLDYEALTCYFNNMIFGRRPTEAIVNLNALRHNLRVIKSAAGSADVIAIVKANAYGHGAVKIAGALKLGGVRRFGVAMVEEGIELRNSGIKDDIFLLSGVFKGEEDEIIKGGFIPFVFDLRTVNMLSRAGEKMRKPVRVHIKVDTGMGRIGILPGEAGVFFRGLKRFRNISVEGIASHFADLGDGGKTFAEWQMSCFRKVIAEGVKEGFNFKYIHIANSAAIFLLPQAHFNLVRPGIALYGVEPYPSRALKNELRPVMELRTEILHIKNVQKNFTVSYGRTFKTRRRSIIATVPVGYADGLDRHLSNNAHVLVRGEKAPVAGRICMDLTMIDVTGIKDVKIGDGVTIIGRQGRESVTAVEIADRIGTIPYEVFTKIGIRVPRRFV